MTPTLASTSTIVTDLVDAQAWITYSTEGEPIIIDTDYQKAAIYCHPRFGKMLFLDGELQSSSYDEFIYHESIVHPAMSSHPRPKRVAILGGGEGGTAREVLRYAGVESVVMIDIDREVIELSKRHLPTYSHGCFSDPRLQIVIDDARRWLASAPNSLDLIISDLTEPGDSGISSQLFSVDFFRSLRAKLTTDGVLALQASEGNFGRLKRHLSIRRNLELVFPVVRSLSCHIPSFGCQWTFIVASLSGDPQLLLPGRVDDILLQRGVSKLRFYDGVTHQRLFSLPRYFRAALAGA